MSQTIAESLYQQGIEKGIEKGELLNARRVLRRLLVKHFGSIPEAVVQRIEISTDLNRLLACIEQAVDLKSVEELPL